MSKTTSRLSFNLSDELVETLREMAERNDTTMTEVLKRAIAVQKFLDDQKSQGLEHPRRGPRGTDPTGTRLVLRRHTATGASPAHRR